MPPTSMSDTLQISQLNMAIERSLRLLANTANLTDILAPPFSQSATQARVLIGNLIRVGVRG